MATVQIRRDYNDILSFGHLRGLAVTAQSDLLEVLSANGYKFYELSSDDVFSEKLGEELQKYFAAGESIRSLDGYNESNIGVLEDMSNSIPLYFQSKNGQGNLYVGGDGQLHQKYFHIKNASFNSAFVALAASSSAGIAQSAFTINATKVLYFTTFDGLNDFKAKIPQLEPCCIFLDEFSSDNWSVFARDLARAAGLSCIVVNPTSRIANLKEVELSPR